ncbi:MAG: hypothetical protein P4L84_15395 [Isosphaeraceae bacterium]|nr:hypothetical protein [Isosphaeraceae bacterium]
MAEHPTRDDGPPDITPIRRLVHKTIRLLRSSWVATGMGLTLGLGLGTLAVLALLDLALPLAEGLRVAALVLVVVPAAWAFATGVVRPLFRRLRPAQVARRIEQHIPGIHNRLVSCIDLDGRDTPRKLSPEFHKRLVREALERIKGFHPRAVVDGRSLRRALLLAATSVLAMGLALGLFADRLPTALARIFSPLSDIPPASGVTYTIEPGDAKVLRGDDVPFLAHVTKGEPDRLQLEIQPDGNAKTLRYDLEKMGPEQWSFTLSGFEKSFHYRVRGGGTWSTLKRVTMVDRPTLVGLHTVLHYPEYMGVPEPRVGPPQVGDVTGPEGSAVEVVAQAEGNVAEGEIQLLATRPKKVEVLDRPERIWFQEQLPDGAAPEGTWAWDLRLLARPAHTEPASAGVHGHRFHSAKVPFEIRSGEHLFALVYIKPDAKPDAIMLSWHDGKDWEHRAYWGEDKFSDGKPDTPSRRKLGPLPTAGEWVRLEVPAAVVGLEHAQVRGMGFALSGGQCYWHRAGALPPGYVERPEEYVAAKFPMASAGSGAWSGRFPLERDVLYRVELRNELGHPSKPMKAAKATAVPDNPPQVVLERPGSDLVLSTPAKVPLSIAAFDDFGLADIVVSIQRGDSGGFVGRPVQHYDRPQRSDNVLAILDLPALELKAGEHVRYRVEARDRKGQSAQTQEFIVRIAADDNAADKQLANYDKGQDAFRENLVKLIAEQAKVQETVKALSAKYAPLEEKLQATRAEERPAPDGAPKPADAAKVPKLDAEATKQLEALRQELAQVAAQEAQNAQLGQNVEAGLKQAAEQAANLKMLPSEMLQQLQGLPQAFQDRALQPLQDLAAEMKQGADAKQAPPDLAAMNREANRLQRELEAVKAQLEAASKARKDLPRDAGDAVAELRREMLRQNADLSARELQELMDFLKAREDELKRLEGQQQQLAEATPKAAEMLLPDIEKRQGELDPMEDKALDEARQLLDAEKLRRMRKDDPDFPMAPFRPEADEQMVPPKEEDPDEPAADKAKDAAKARKNDEAKKKDVTAKDDEDPLFMPALGGPRPKLDPRFADKLRPVPPKAAAKKGDHPPDLDARREELAARQQQRLADLDTARQALASDEHALDALLGQLREALNQEDAARADQLLGELLHTPALQQALAMVQRSQRVAHNRQATPANAAATQERHQPTTDQVGSPLNAQLAELDIETRTVILKMQPQLREELLQGLREEGPEGYKAFIRDYFKRLTKVKGK